MGTFFFLLSFSLFIHIGATNRPQDLDEAARRRLTKRIYVPLPEPIARRRLIENMLKVCCHMMLRDFFPSALFYSIMV